MLRYLAEAGDNIVLSVLKYNPSPHSYFMSSGPNLTESSPDTLSMSMSPKSPHSRLWSNTSPDSNKLSLKSSGSQTDSLDSPPTSARSPTDAFAEAENKQNLMDRAYIKIFGKPFPTERERERDRDRDLLPNVVGNLGINRGGNIVSPSSSHDSPPPLPSHPPPPPPQHRPTEEDEVLNELDDIIHRFAKTPTTTTLGSREKRSRRIERDENGGTWPKRHGIDFPSEPQGFAPPVMESKRPPLSTIINDHSYVRTSSSPSGVKVAPTPPERSDSFSRSKSINSSIKHSPQSSAESQKYSLHSTSQTHHTTSPQSHLTSIPPSSHPHSGHHGVSSPLISATSNVGTHHIATHTPSNATQLVSPTTQSSSYLSSPMSKQSSHTLPSPKSMEKEKKAMHSLMDKSKSGSGYDKPIHYDTDNSGYLLDNTVKSANQEHLQRYLSERPARRPKSADGMRSRDRKREIGKLIHGSHGSGRASDHPIQKPTSLDIHPTYSPRPLPHSRQNITPSSHGPTMSSRTEATSPMSRTEATSPSQSSSSNNFSSR